MYNELKSKNSLTDICMKIRNLKVITLLNFCRVLCKLFSFRLIQRDEAGAGPPLNTNGSLKHVFICDNSDINVLKVFISCRNSCELGEARQKSLA